jgi:carboxypeptidase C (cathepsin A)
MLYSQPIGFTGCSIAVNRAFLENGDMYHSTGLWVAGLLERGVRTLIYVGENDLLCNWVGNSRWLAALDWSGHDAYTKAEERVWKYDGQGVGRTRSAGPLTYATLRGAGHFVSAALLSLPDDDLK